MIRENVAKGERFFSLLTQFWASSSGLTYLFLTFWQKETIKEV